MSGTTMMPQEQKDRQVARSAAQPARQIAERGQTLAPARSLEPWQVRPHANGEIRDPLGNFSEAVGAYFG